MIWGENKDHGIKPENVGKFGSKILQLSKWGSYRHTGSLSSILYGGHLLSSVLVK